MTRVIELRTEAFYLQLAYLACLGFVLVAVCQIDFLKL